MSVAELVQAIRGKRKQKFESTAVEYNAAITELAAGKQVDVERLAELLDSLDRSDSDLEADVEAKSRRLAAAARIAELRKIQASLPALRAESELAQKNLSEAIAKLKPIAQAVERKLFDAENNVAAIGHEESILMSVGVADHITARQAALRPRQTELVDLRAEYHERTGDAAGRLRQLLENERNLTSRIESPHAFDEAAKKQMAAELEAVRAEIPRRREYIQTWDGLKQRIETLSDELEAEQAAIKQMLMVP